jgi:hypothetical protein
MVLQLAAAEPAPVRRAARGDTAGEHPQRPAVREADGGLPAGGDVPARSDEAVARHEVKRRIDCERLHDAVQVEQRPGRSREQPAREPDRPPAAGLRRARRPLVADRQRGEVPVVAGRLDSAAERRIDEPVRRRRRGKRVTQDGREEPRDDQRPRVLAVDAVQLAVGPEAREGAVPAIEEALDGLELIVAQAADDDVDAHRAERPPLRRHASAPAAAIRWRERRSPSRSRSRRYRRSCPSRS